MPSVLFLATSTALYRFDNPDTRAATLPPTTITLPPGLTRPGPIKWDPTRGGLFVSQRVGNTPVGLWFADDAATVTAPTWVEVGDDRYKSAAIYTQGMVVGPDGTLYVSGWGNAAIVGEPQVVTPPPTGFSIVETWETSALASSPTNPPSAFNGTGRARITDLNPYEGTRQVEFDPVAQVGYVDTPVFGPVTNIAVDIILDLQTLPSVNTRFISGRLGTVAQSGVQLLTTGGLVLQDVNASRDTAGPVLTVPGRYRVAAMFDSVTDVCRLRVWTGPDLSVATPTYDSGEKAYTTGGNTEVIRLGAVAAVTWLARMDAVRVLTDGTWPVRPTTGGGGTASATAVGFIPVGF